MVRYVGAEFSSPPAFDPQALIVFGEKRLTADAGHEANPESTTELVGTVSAICEAADRAQDESERGVLRQTHTLYPPNGMPLVLENNSAPIANVRDKLEGARVSVANVTQGSRRTGFKKYPTNETLLVDGNDIAYILSRLYKPDGQEIVASATKLATEPEVRRVIDQVRTAAASQPALNNR